MGVDAAVDIRKFLRAADYTVTLAAGTLQQIDGVAGAVGWRIVEAIAPIFVSFDGERYVKRREGDAGSGVISTLFLRNDSAGPITVRFTLVWGQGALTLGSDLPRPANYIANIPNSSIAVGGNTFITGSGYQRKVVISSLASNTEPVKVGATGAAGGTGGAELSPGETIEIETTATIYIRNPSGNAAAQVISAFVISYDPDA